MELLVVLLYFWPSTKAFITSKQHLGRIFWLNLLLGWTIAGWIVAYGWTALDDPPPAFDVPAKRVLANARAIASKYHRITGLDEARGFLTFRTGTSFSPFQFDCSLTVTQGKNQEVHIQLEVREVRGVIWTYLARQRVINSFYRRLEEEIRPESTIG